MLEWYFHYYNDVHKINIECIFLIQHHFYSFQFQLVGCKNDADCKRGGLDSEWQKNDYCHDGVCKRKYFP